MQEKRFFVLHRGLFDKLTLTERFVLSYIECFSRKGNAAEASAEYIAERLCISVVSVKRASMKLEKLGFITTERHKAKKSGNKWGRPRNRYTVVKSEIDANAAKWKKAHKAPEVVAITQKMITLFGASTQCILAATLDAVQKAADNLKEYDAMYGTISYSQADLAVMCGCNERSIRDILREFESVGFIEQIETNFTWKKSRKSYIFHIPDTGKFDTKSTGKNDTKTATFQQQKDTNEAKKDEKKDNKTATGKNDTKTPEKMIRKPPEKMIRNENTSYLIPMSEQMSEDFFQKNPCACDVENSCDAVSREQAQQARQRKENLESIKRDNAKHQGAKKRDAFMNGRKYKETVSNSSYITDDELRALRKKLQSEKGVQQHENF